MRNKCLEKMGMQGCDCCDMGSYEHCVPMAIRGRIAGVDLCIADIVAALNTSIKTQTVGSCCGHGKMVGTVILEDGRWLLVCDEAQAKAAVEMLKESPKED